MAIELLDERKIQAALLANKKAKLADGGGLVLDVRSAKAASWVFKWTRANGKPDEMGLGPLSRLDLTAARALRRRWQDELNAGRCPKEVRDAERLEAARAAEAADVKPIYELVKANFDLITAGGVECPNARKKWVRSMHKDYLGRIASMQPQDVTEADVMPQMRLLFTGRDERGRQVRQAAPVQAEYVRANLHRTLEWARLTKKITTEGWVNPAHKKLVSANVNVKRENEEESHASLPAVHLGAFLASARNGHDKQSAPVVATCLEWQIISASRPNEAVAAEWSEIDWANDCWAIPGHKMKKGRPHRVPLTDRHHEILEAMKGDREEWPKSGFIFAMPGKVTGPIPHTLRHLFKVTLRRTFKAEQFEREPTLYGCRGAFGTWARAAVYEVTLPNGQARKIRIYDEALIEECLSHVVGTKVRNAYVRDDFLEQRREIMADWAAYATKVHGEVVPLRGRRKAA